MPRGATEKYQKAKTCWYKFTKIIETNFENVDEIFKANYVDGESGIENIETTDQNINYNEPIEIYNINGMSAHQ